MVRKKKPGRTRLDIVADAAWIDTLAKAAAAADRSISSYIRTAVTAQMIKDGFEIPATNATPPNRPKKK
jgi:hypothetical protein